MYLVSEALAQVGYFGSICFVFLLISSIFFLFYAFQLWLVLLWLLSHVFYIRSNSGMSGSPRVKSVKEKGKLKTERKTKPKQMGQDWWTGLIL